MLKVICISTAVLSGIGAGANGLLMLLAPQRWFFSIPGVSMTGRFNQHFVRDVGLSFLLVGIAFLVGAKNPHQRVILWGAASMWLCGHAAFHLWEVAAGMSAPSAIARDFAPVSLPAAVGAGLTFWATRTAVAGSHALPLSA
jgi:hypothetical protein